MRRARRRAVGKLARGRRESRIDPRQRLPIGLVAAMRIRILRGGREREQPLRRGYQAIRQRQLGAELVDLGQVMQQDERRLRAARVLQRLGDDERVAVAIAADPRAHPQQRRRRERGPIVEREAIFERRIQPRNLVEKSVTVVSEPVVDLVADLQRGQADHRRLPQRQHLPIEPGPHRIVLFRRQRAAVAPLQQPGDFTLGIENALALDFGRVRGEHRTHQRLREDGAQCRFADAGRAQPVQRMGDAARLRRRAGDRVCAPPPVLVDVFGDIGQMREIAERANDVERLCDRQLIQQTGELVLDRRRVVGRGTAQTDCGLPDRFDARIAALSRLRAQHIAKQTSQQTRVLLERQVLVDGRIHSQQPSDRSPIV